MADAAKFAKVRHAARIWAVAAIHGDAPRLTALHDALAERFEETDRLVYLGNYLGRGRDIVATIDELLRFRRELIAQPRMFASDIVYLRGSQEEMWQKLLQLQFAIDPKQVLEWMLTQGVEATIAAYGGDPRKGIAAARDGAMSITRWTSGLRAGMAARPGHQSLVSALRRAAYSDTGHLLFVHAGVDPSRPLSAQSDSLWWGSAGFAKLDAPYEGFKLVVRGHDRAHGGVVRANYTLTVDAGCGYGGPLCAVCLSPEGELLDKIEI
jgi:serine/threonine protein phosphatase 1